jgi:hypothetical protein
VDKRAVAILAVCLVAVFLATPALAQGRDPFREPAGAGADAGSVPEAPDGGEVVVPPSSGDLPRTGLDLATPVVAALALVLAGASMRLVGEALAL